MRVFVVGAGISGLATAFRIRERFLARQAPLDLRVLEAEERPGGKIRSEEVAGYLMEWGPNGFLDSKPDTLKLCRDLGIGGDLLPCNAQAAKRFIFSGGRLHRVPEGPGAFFRSRLLSMCGRVRIVKELWAPVTPPGVDTTIAEFGRRRLGREAEEKLLAPMVSGIYAGDAEILSIAACFPRILELEQQHGSLVRAMFSLMKEKKRQSKALRKAGDSGEREAGKAGTRSGPAGPGGTLTSFQKGLEHLVRVLERQLGGVVHTRSPVRAIRSENGEGARSRLRVRFESQGAAHEEDADAIVLAVPAYEASSVLASIDPAVSQLLSAIPYSPVMVVGLGFRDTEAPGPLDGFGFLIPHAENTPVLGSLWTSSIFPGRAPPGFVFTRNMVGGSRNPGVVDSPDDDLQELVAGIFRRAMGDTGKVAFRKIVRHRQAIPLYTLGHNQRLKEMEERLARFPGLYLTGNAFRGVALNDCTREAERVAQRIEEDLLGGGGRVMEAATQARHTSRSDVP